MRSVTSPTRAWREVVMGSGLSKDRASKPACSALPCSDKDGMAPELRTSRASPAPRLCQPLARFRPITRCAFAPKRAAGSCDRREAPSTTLLDRVGQSAEPKDVTGSDLGGNNDSRGD